MLKDICRLNLGQIMARKKASDHVHKYERKSLPKRDIYKCTLCPSWVISELIEGRVSMCWRCSKPFRIDKRAGELKRPHCIDCVKKRDEPIEVEQPSREQDLKQENRINLLKDILANNPFLE